MDVTRENMLAALKYAEIIELPEPEDKTKVWVFAIALVHKMNGRKEYVIAKHDFNDNGTEVTTIIKDLGSVSSIVKIEEIYPYEYVTEAPKLANKEAMITYINNILKKDKALLRTMDKEQMQAMLKKALIKAHINNN